MNYTNGDPIHDESITAGSWTPLITVEADDPAGVPRTATSLDLWSQHRQNEDVVTRLQYAVDTEHTFK